MSMDHFEHAAPVAEDTVVPETQDDESALALHGV